MECACRALATAAGPHADALADATPEAAARAGAEAMRAAAVHAAASGVVSAGRPPPRDASAADGDPFAIFGGANNTAAAAAAAANAIAPPPAPPPMGASFAAPTLPPGVPAVEAETLARVIRCVEGCFNASPRSADEPSCRRRCCTPPRGEGGDGDAEALPDMRCPSAACSAPLFGRLAGVNDGGDAAIEALAGGAQPPPIVRPVELTLVPDRVANIGEAAAAMRKAVHCCVLLANQSELLPNTFALRASLLVHLFCSVLPAPMPLNHPRRLSSCFWASDRDVRYETQAEILRCLRLLLQHFGAATLSLTATRSFDAARLLSLASLASIADAVLRLRVVDHPSPFCQHYAGDADGPTAPFGFEMGPFAVEAEYLRFHCPERTARLTQVMDYFHGMRATVTSEDHLVFRWERGAVLARAIENSSARCACRWDSPWRRASCPSISQGSRASSGIITQR